jgi:hypothetical protein
MVIFSTTWFGRNTKRMQLCNRNYYSKVHWRNNKFYYKAESCWYFYWIIYDARIHKYQIQYNNLFPKTGGELQTEVKQARYASIFRKSAQWILFLLSCCTNYHPRDNTHCFRSAIFLQYPSRWENIVTSQTADPTLARVNTSVFWKTEDWVEVFSFYSGSFYIRVNAVITNPLTHFSDLTTIIACIYYREGKKKTSVEWGVGAGKWGMIKGKVTINSEKVNVVYLNNLPRYWSEGWENHEKPVTIICNMVCIQSGYYIIIPLLIVNKTDNIIIRQYPGSFV